LCSHVNRREPGSGVAEVSDHVDVVIVEPISSNIHGDICLVGIIGDDNLDGFTEHLAAEIVHGHSHRENCSWASDVRKETGHVRENTDLHDTVGDLGGGLGRVAGNARSPGNRRSQKRSFRDPHRDT
jgi:hypothetical protein